MINNRPKAFFITQDQLNATTIHCCHEEWFDGIWLCVPGVHEENGWIVRIYHFFQEYNPLVNITICTVGLPPCTTFMQLILAADLYGIQDKDQEVSNMFLGIKEAILCN
jgi:hypothetical protein